MQSRNNEIIHRLFHSYNGIPKKLAISQERVATHLGIWISVSISSSCLLLVVRWMDLKHNLGIARRYRGIQKLAVVRQMERERERVTLMNESIYRRKGRYQHAEPS